MAQELNKYKKYLDKTAYTEEDKEQIIRELLQFAEICIDNYLRGKDGQSEKCSNLLQSIN